MRFLLLLWGDAERERALGEAGLRRIMEEHGRFSERLREASAYVDGAALVPAARTVRREQGLVTDGPFAETKEQLGGFYLLECADLAEAESWAQQVPMSPGLVAEIRPLG